MIDFLTSAGSALPRLLSLRSWPGRILSPPGAAHTISGACSGDRLREQPSGGLARTVTPWWPDWAWMWPTRRSWSARPSGAARAHDHRHRAPRGRRLPGCRRRLGRGKDVRLIDANEEIVIQRPRSSAPKQSRGASWSVARR